MQSNILRVGVCGCACRYHGKLGGRQIIVRRLEDSKLSLSVSFILQEVILPEDPPPIRRLALRGSRAHFFLDHNPPRVAGDLPWGSVTLSLNQLVSSGLGYGAGKGEKLYMGGGFLRGLNQWGERKYWMGRDQKRPPTVATILASMRELIAKMTQAQFESWLRRMTPSDWQMVGYATFPAEAYAKSCGACG